MPSKLSNGSKCNLPRVAPSPIHALVCSSFKSFIFYFLCSLSLPSPLCAIYVCTQNTYKPFFQGFFISNKYFHLLQTQALRSIRSFFFLPQKHPNKICFKLKKKKKKFGERKNKKIKTKTISGKTLAIVVYSK